MFSADGEDKQAHYNLSSDAGKLIKLHFQASCILTLFSSRGIVCGSAVKNASGRPEVRNAKDAIDAFKNITDAVNAAEAAANEAKAAADNALNVSRGLESRHINRNFGQFRILHDFNGMVFVPIERQKPEADRKSEDTERKRR